MMLRSVGIAAVVVGLAWTGLAGAQSSSPLEKARYINVSEEGKPPQRCKLLKTWREANGAPAFQVQAVDTGELMTILGTSPNGAAGDSREMTTRIFRWGRDNRPPAGAPVPPLAAAAATTPTQPVAVQKPPTIAPQPIRPAPVVTTPRPTTTPMIVQKPSFAPVPLPAQKPNPAPALTPVQPASMPTVVTGSKSVTPTIVTGSKPATPTIVTSSQPASPTIVTKPAPVVSSKPRTLTPMGTQVVQYAPPAPPVNRLPDAPSVTDTTPRLAPLPAGSTASTSCNCPCSQACNSCCQSCNPCQSSCVCSTPSPMRQPLIGRLFKSNTSCPCTTVVSAPPSVPAQNVGTSVAKPAAATPPAVTVVKATTEPAKPSDWRQSWGKVEPWKETAKTTVRPIEVSRRVDPKPVTLETPAQPDPLKAPDQYRDMVMSSRLANSKIPQVTQPPAHPVEEPKAVNGGMPHGQMVEVSADEPNAFWAPKAPKARQEVAKINAFDRESPTPPPSAPPAFGGAPASGRRPLPDIPGVAIPMLPPRPPVMNMPTPPLPATAAQRGPMVMRPDGGVPAAMGNAFTLTGTSRPIPADFGGTPQEPNGFAPPTRVGMGSPPLAYGMAMPGASRPQAGNMMAMGTQSPMGVNPYVNVPSAPYGQAAVSTGASAPTGGVPQLLTALKDSLRPSEREAAADQLSELDWHIQPLVVESLMKSARDDPAPTVRAACVHALGHMKVDSPAALALVRDLKSDRDPSVRHEAEEALNTLGDSGIQQASHK